MTLKEQLAEKKSALKALEEDIKAENEEAIAEGEEIAAAIAEIEKSIESAEKANALLEQIGKEEEPEEETGMEEKTGLKALNLEYLKDNRGTVGCNVNLKTYSDPEAMGDNLIIDYDKNPVNVMPALGVRDLFGAETISGNALTYYVLGSAEGTVEGTAEGAAKDRIHIPYTPKTAALTKIAAYFKETDELIHDAAFLESAIRNRGVYEFNKVIEAYLINTLAAATGVQSVGTAITFDNILQAKQDIMADTSYTADALVINPSDWATLLQAKDDNKQYLLGGPAYGSYGNGGYNSNPKVWGLTVVESAAVTSGNCIVGAFKVGASVVTQAGNGQRVEVSNSDQDDFIKNMVTVRIEERLVEAVRIPAAFALVGAESS